MSEHLYLHRTNHSPTNTDSDGLSFIRGATVKRGLPEVRGASNRYLTSSVSLFSGPVPQPFPTKPKLDAAAARAGQRVGYCVMIMLANVSLLSHTVIHARR